MSADAEFVPLETALIILQAREAARDICGERYSECVEPYKTIIAGIEDCRGCSLVDAVVWLANDLKAANQYSVFAFSAFADLCNERGIELGTAS